MADYKELIRKAIQALPENNGAARRAVYEKARAALVGQLRGLNPPLAARDITQHRLQLEDCIRQVEQEASEAVIAGLKQNEELPPPPQAALPPPSRPSAMTPPRAANAANGGAAARPAGNSAGSRPAGSPRAGSLPASRANAPVVAPRPAATGRPSAAPKPQAVPRVAAVQPKSTAAVAAATRAAPSARSLPRSQTALYPRAVPAPEPELEEEAEQQDTIEDIIAAAESDSAPPYDNDESAHPLDDERAAEPPMFKLEPRAAPRKPTLAPAAAPPARVDARPMPAIVARAEAAKAVRAGKANDAARRPNGAEARRDVGNQPARLPPPQPGRQAAAEPAAAKGRNTGTAMSSVREVEVEPQGEGDPQVAIERAIATLEREARNDGDEGANGAETAVPNGRGNGANSPGRRRQAAEPAFRETAANNDAAFARGSVEQEKGGGSAVTIFLLVFLVLLIGAGGAGFWAWREGYIDFDAMFGKAQTSVAQIVTPQPAAIAPKPGGVAPKPVKTVPVSGSGAQTNTEPASNTPAQSAEAMSAAPAAAAPAVATTEPSAQSGPKSEERLSTTGDGSAAPAAPGDDQASNGGGAAASPAGSQSLLLEASQDGTTGAVPFSGTVEWTKGTDEMGQPTLVGKASIPARNLGVSVLIRRNADPTLPASHLMEINFTVNDSFIGGAISGLPGVLLKNEELVQGTPLVGASARVVGNSFLFALSSSAADEATNKDLLTSRKWIDLAIIYATGKKAIITLEKDDKAEALFNDVFSAWQKEAAATPAAAAPAAAGK